MSDHQKPLRLEQLSIAGRKSRDQIRKSNLPRLTIHSNLVDRVSGVKLLDSVHASGSRSVNRSTSAGIRNRSAESNRHTMIYHKPRPQSAQRPNFQRRPTTMMNLETPLSRGFHSKDSLITPMSSINNHKVFRARTPSSEHTRTQRHIIEKILSAVPNKDRRPVTDQSWLRATEAHIVSRLKEDDDFQSVLPTSAAPLRPITIRLFLDITNHLLIKCAGSRFEVNASNYLIKLPQIAQKFLYPGVMSKSWLKSVNAMHSYSNVLAFLSYLIDFADHQEKIRQSMDGVKLYGDDQNGKMLSLRHEYYFETWRHFQDNTDFNAVTDKYIEDLKFLNNLCEEDNEDNIKRLNDLRNKKNEIAATLDKMKQINNTFDTESTTLHGKGRHLRELKMELSHDLAAAENNLESERNKMNHTKNHISELENRIATLRVQLSNQKMTLDERENILKEVDLLNEGADGDQDILSEMEKLNFGKDIELVAEQKKALMASLSVNKSLMTISSSLNQDLTSYMLKQRELLSEKTPEIIKNTSLMLKEILKETEKRLHDKQQQKDSEVTHLQQIKLKANQLKEQANSLETSIPDIEKRIELKKSKILAAKSAKEVLNARRAKLQENKMKEEDALLNAKEKLAYWTEQDLQWQKNLNQLRNEEGIIREQCKQRADAVISECFTIVKELQPVLNQNPNTLNGK